SSLAVPVTVRRTWMASAETARYSLPCSNVWSAGYSVQRAWPGMALWASQAAPRSTAAETCAAWEGETSLWTSCSCSARRLNAVAAVDALPAAGVDGNIDHHPCGDWRPRNQSSSFGSAAWSYSANE